MEMHFATVWEAIADTVPDAPAVVHGDRRLTWSAYEQRAARLAAALTAHGLEPDAKLGLFLYNSPEYLEAQFAGMKQRLVPVNVNYRYLDEELRYLLDNADAEALVFHSSLGERVAAVAGRLPKLRVLVEVDDGVGAGRVDRAVRYEALVAAHEPAARIERPEDDVYMLYTGGTTGMPKGVMYAIGGITAGLIESSYAGVGLPVPASADEIPALVLGLRDGGRAPVVIPACPLMHGTGMWLGAMLAHDAGGVCVTLPSRVVRHPRALGDGGAGASDDGDDRRRPVRQADARRPRRGRRAGRALRHEHAQLHRLVGRDVRSREQGGLDRPGAAGGHRRRHRFERGRHGTPAHREGPPGPHGAVLADAHHEGVHRGRPRGRARLRRSRPGRRRRQRPHRLLQGSPRSRPARSR